MCFLLIFGSTKDSYEFLYGLLFFIGITYAVILYTASVNEQSKELKDVLYAVPSKGYGVEVTYTYICLSNRIKL